MNDMVVNSEGVSLHEAMGWAAVVQGPDLRSFAIEQVAIAQAARAQGLQAETAEMQARFNTFRRANRLEARSALEEWMGARGVAMSTMQTAMEQAVLRDKLRAEISAEEIAGVYAETRPTYDRAEIYRIRVEEADLAWELRAKVETDNESFCLLAIEFSTDDATAHMGGWVGAMTRAELPGAVEAEVFAARPGTLVGPVKTALGHEVLMIYRQYTLPLSDVAEDIRDSLFRKRVAQILRNARISHDDSDSAQSGQGPDSP